jgi:predicted RNase H-like HicB family nuclease
MKFLSMKVSYTYWREPDGHYLGYLNQFPDHWTQGTDLEDLKAQLMDLFKTLSEEDIPGIRRVAELEIA